MGTKFVYVLVSSEKDVYLEQAYISMSSLKHHNSEAFITLVIDSATKDSLTEIRKYMTSIADEIICINLDRGIKAQKRSRLLKTGLRNYIKGDYLFIDTDTIILRSLSFVNEIEYDICAVWDTHALLNDNPYKEKCYAHVKRMGGSLRNEMVYYNSGVMFFKDSSVAHDFCERWTENYLRFIRQMHR